MAQTRRKLHPPIRPDGSIFRSSRAAPPDPAWGLIPVNPDLVREARYEHWGSQREFAQMLSTPQHNVVQSEVHLLETTVCWVNEPYLRRLGAALILEPDQLRMTPEAAEARITRDHQRLAAKRTMLDRFERYDLDL